MQSSLNDMLETTWSFLPNLAAATAILIGGWIVARILAVVVRGGLSRTELDNRMAAWLDGVGEPFPVERVVSRGVFYLVMLFVLVAFFEALRLDLITEPLTALLTQLSEFAPRVLAAGGLLLVAWVVATALRKIVGTALAAAKIDSRLAESTLESGEPLPLSRTLADALYWLVFLLFLPAVLGALAIEGLLAPVQGLTDQLLGFIPNLLAAGLIFAVGWMVARLVQRIVSNLLAAAGADSFPERLGFDGMGAVKVSGLIGLVLYVLILVPVVISSLNALQLDAITAPASDMLAQILNAVPGLFAAALLMVIAFAVGKLVSTLLTSVLAGAGFDGLLARLGFAGVERPAGRSLSEISGSLALVFIMVFASVEAADMIGFAALSAILGGLIEFGGQVLLGLFVLATGLWLAELAATTVRESGLNQADTLATAARVSVIALAGAMALRQMGLGERIIELAFGLTLGAVAVAAALAFGLGSREVAGEFVRSWKDAKHD
ncbi:MAG: mechanosensitive ion channel [Gemmatimonadetes bacterium]|nr:mechanosensitive ion channel [Gemmatimonadota bacterium]